jgi:hypothetical protein
LGFPRDLLADHEEIVFELRPHWVALIPGGLGGLLIVLVGVVVVGIINNSAGRTITALGVVALLLLMVLPGTLRWYFTLFVLTSDRLITRGGSSPRAPRKSPWNA